MAHDGAIRTILRSDDDKKMVRVAGSEADKDGEWKSWSLTGTADEGSVDVDFTPKGGPKDLNGKLTEKGITWPDGNTWVKIYDGAQTRDSDMN